jgi:F-type H+-transporting ATPase subunit alpha
MIKGSGAGMLDDIPVAQVSAFERGFLAMVNSEYPEIAKTLREKKEFTDEAEAKFKEAIARFREQFKAK